MDRGVERTPRSGEEGCGGEAEVEKWEDFKEFMF